MNEQRTHKTLDELDKTLAERAEKTLHLDKPFYSIQETMALLHLSRAKLYHYLSDPELQIETVHIPVDRKRYIQAKDIKLIWMVRNTVYVLPFARKAVKAPPAIQEIPKSKTRPRIGRERKFAVI